MASNPFTTTVAAYAALSGLAAKSNGQVLDASETNELKEAAKRFNSWVRGNAEMAAGLVLEVPLIGIGGTDKIRSAATIAALEALTDSSVAVGDKAIAPGFDRILEALTATGGGSTWGWRERFSWHTGLGNIATTAKRYLQRQGTSGGTSLGQNLSAWAFGRATKVVGAAFYSSENLGSVLLEVHINGAAAADGDTQTVNAATAAFSFDTDLTDLAIGERAEFGVTCGSAPSGTGVSDIELQFEQVFVAADPV